MVGFIITFFVILVFIICLGTLRWRATWVFYLILKLTKKSYFFNSYSVLSSSIKDYITPNIPHPKATLAQMHKVIQFLMCLVASLIFCKIKHMRTSVFIQAVFMFSGPSFHFQSWDIQWRLHTPCGLRWWKAIFSWASRRPGWAPLQSSQFLKNISEWNGHESWWLSSKRAVPP